MRWLLLGAAALALCTLVTADCPGACSGHGDCKTNNDFCECYLGWMGNDCSQQLCPYGLSYIDTPNGDIDGDNTQNGGGFDTGHTSAGSTGPINPMYRAQGTWERHPAQQYGAIGEATLFPIKANEGHFYAECSNRGVCDRSTGMCSCFTSYEGTACNRTTCVNSCSGHGICETINDVTPVNKHYRLWDAEKTRLCKCDGGYFGVDCSQKKCMRNDDPLTTMTSHQYYTSGLTERGEVQQVDIRCPYNGNMMGPAYVTLTYTDAQFGDVYESPMFDMLTATGPQILALLRALPNQVLASYDSNAMNKVTSVVVSTIDAGNFYRLTVTFDKLLGNVPLLSGTPYFKCQGGAEVLSTAENVKVTYLGDGPAYDLSFVFSGFSSGAANYIVNNASGLKTTGDQTTAATAHTFNTAFAAEALTSASTWTREATKVMFQWGLKTTSHSTESMTINIHTVPVITARNIMFTLRSAGTLRNVVSTTSAHVATLDGTGQATQPAIDFILNALMITSTVARLSVNGEVWGLVTIGGALDGAVLEAGTATWTSAVTFGALGTTVSTYVGKLSLTCATCAAADNVNFYFPKDPVASANYYASAGVPSASYFSAGAIEDIFPSYLNFQAPIGPFSLVLQITLVSTSTDQYRWKLAGDIYWSDTTVSVNTVTGVVTTSSTGSTVVPATNAATALGNQASFLGTYPDDPVRQSTASVLLAWNSGPDNQKRLCNTAAATYYMQFGSDGLNDSPECSDRGVCDYSTGICKCFKGYAGIDCTTQNALSMGAGGGGTATTAAAA